MISMGQLASRARVQRRGVSDGGVAVMSRPFSRETVVRSGKVREIAAACDVHDAGAVAFLNPLTVHQEQVLAELLGRPVVSISQAGGPTPQAPGTES
jgi:50S ribosomal subunit-associated GTPase HflX